MFGERGWMSEVWELDERGGVGRLEGGLEHRGQLVKCLSMNFH